MKQQFTAVYKKSGKWYLGWVEELSGVNTQGRTIAEVRENLKDALMLVIETNRLVNQNDAGKTARREPLLVTV
ncbi:MAG: type II toxin-antitoxin system HicB family antitoxin [Candidatus Yonathbacteria bacterium]|nr:type II toxin-antitoxin system HicB family antitoxin [Candidatus Yonathbacteria bacterium]